ncbi:hypothetical protein E2562_019683 [Oryza meyeriana var. granulata]|uniref:Uncharacterized protein n=1 Tax=Oryza meyeriana var. granulata TaxID=110450 RepID=A0A6G1C8S9_9ORYZ|nr:hypothetical protein E2562_019683 [Oryza meyeriana var. granulata]
MARLTPVGITQPNLFGAISVLFLAQAPVSMWLKDVFVVIELAVYIVLMLFLFKVSEQYWQPLLSTAVVSPLFLLPLYSAPILRDAYVKKYTKRPVGSKELWIL